MNIVLPHEEYRSLHGGMDDDNDAIEVSNTSFTNIENFFIERNSPSKRNGYQNRLGVTLESGAYVQHIEQLHEAQDSADEPLHLFYILNAKAYYDNGTTRSDVTNSKVIGTDPDKEIQSTNYDGRIVFTDQVNPPCVWPYNINDKSDRDPAGSGKLVTVSSVTQAGTDFITTARAVTEFHDFLMFGGVTDVDGAFHGARIVWNRINRLDIWDTANFIDIDTTDQIVTMVKHGEWILIFMRRSCYYIKWVGAGGPLNSPFIIDKLNGAVGALSAKSVVPTERGTFYFSATGVYMIKPDSLEPLYVGKPVKNWFSTINKGKRRRIFGVEVPDRQSIMWCCPYGSGQATNNRALVLNYEEWHREGYREYPAFSQFVGVAAQPFVFQSGLAYTDENGARGVLLGNAGKIFNFDVGGYDESTTYGIPWKIQTPYYRPAGAGVVKIWYRGTVDISTTQVTSVTITYQLLNQPFAYTGTITAQGLPVPVGTFVVGTDRVGSDNDGTLVFDLDGSSRYIQLTISGEAKTTELSVKAFQLFFDTVGTRPSFG